MSVKESLIELPAQYSSAVFGQLDEYAKKIERIITKKQLEDNLAF